MRGVLADRTAVVAAALSARAKPSSTRVNPLRSTAVRLEPMILRLESMSVTVAAVPTCCRIFSATALAMTDRGRLRTGRVSLSPGEQGAARCTSE